MVSRKRSTNMEVGRRQGYQNLLDSSVEREKEPRGLPTTNSKTTDTRGNRFEAGALMQTSNTMEGTLPDLVP